VNPDLIDKAPFPWFGGKSRVADLVWERFGDVPNYVEPFAGSLAVLLGRPYPPNTETVNDLDCMIANFWRALQADPHAVASYADNPVNEADLTARHYWLTSRVEFRERMKTDPDYYDPKIAGWWVWGQSCWIGSGWCAGALYRKRPHLWNAGMGVHRQLPHLTGVGNGVHQHLDEHGGLHDYMQRLACRLRKVRVCCGDWSRVLGPSPTFKHGLTGVFLDPPYSDEANRDEHLYTEEDLTIAHRVREWAIEHGDNPLLRIALCGYEGEHTMPDSWECVPWKAHGGYGSQGDNNARMNSAKERIWFSPACMRAFQLVLGDGLAVRYA
jgi:DNA adenine methylase